MAGWDEILIEIQSNNNDFDLVRRKYLKNLSDYTQRETIAYYSAFMTKSGIKGIELNDSDMNGFMNSVQGLDCSKGLDLILHTPGGDPAAAEAIMNYLRKKFNKDIRVIVPQSAFSAGTMIAFASKEILMGSHSCLGPIDPQFNGISAINIKKEFEDAKEDLEKNPQNTSYWALKLQKYPAAFLKTAIDAIDLASELARTWLGSCMFDDNVDADKEKIDLIVKEFNDNQNSKVHSRHIMIDKCKSLGLKVNSIEDDQLLQDAILSLHHCYIQLLQNTNVIKIIENNHSKTMIISTNVTES